MNWQIKQSYLENILKGWLNKQFAEVICFYVSECDFIHWFSLAVSTSLAPENWIVFVKEKLPESGFLGVQLLSAVTCSSSDSMNKINLVLFICCFVSLFCCLFCTDLHKHSIRRHRKAERDSPPLHCTCVCTKILFLFSLYFYFTWNIVR